MGRSSDDRIPQRVLEEAARPALQALAALVPEAPPSFRGLLADMAEHLLDSGVNMSHLWKGRRLNPSSHTGMLVHFLGTTPWSYLRGLRIEIGLRLLADPRIAEVSGATIALESGFKSYSALNEAVKERFGMTPAQYRKACLAGKPPAALARAGSSPGARAASGEEAGLEETLGALDQVASSLARADRLTVFGELELAEAELRRAAGRIAGLGHPPTLTALLDARRGFLSHRRAEFLLRGLDVDGAWAELEKARTFYGLAGELPPVTSRLRRDVPLPDDVRLALTGDLCRRCAPELEGETAAPVDVYLVRALSAVPRDLEWFRDCCDECYRAVWSALGKARLGLVDDAWKATWLGKARLALVDDAWKATWLVAHADPLDQVPPSLARYVRALHESEVLTHEEQLPRSELCETAVETARAFGDPLREAYALCYAANAARAMASFDEARQKLRDAGEHCQENPWSAALLAEIEGRLAVNEKNQQLASNKLSTARALYHSLDLHLVGYVLIAQGELLFNERGYEAAVQAFEEASTALDRRRAPVLASGAIPLNCAAALGALSRQTEAKAALCRCEFDRSEHRRMAATELLVSGCLALAEGEREKALEHFGQAATTFEVLDRLREKVLAISYSVEAYAGLGKRAEAIESAAEALRLFQALGCKQDTVEAFTRLGRQLGAAVVDAARVASTVRRLAEAHGGWLP